MMSSSHPVPVVLNRAARPNVVGVGAPPRQPTPVLLGAQQQQIMRVQTPTSGSPQARPIGNVQGKNLVINQFGVTVPLTTLQQLQPGQMIPAGTPGHMLAKMENGQYQILKVSQSAGVPVVPGANIVTTSMASGAIRPLMATPKAVSSTVRPTAVSLANAAAPAPAAAATGAAGGGSGGMGQQMTPDTAKVKCKNFLATLLRLASEQPPAVAANVRNLIQGLIDGNVEPEVFTNRLQRELNSSPQPCLVPFLKKSLPYLQQSLRSGELKIDGVRAPPVVMHQPQAATLPQQSHLGAAVRIHRPPPPPTQTAAVISSSNAPRPSPVAITVNNAGLRGAALPGLPRTMLPSAAAAKTVVHSAKGLARFPSSSPAIINTGIRSMPLATTQTSLSSNLSTNNLSSMSPGGVKKEKMSSSSSFSTAGDEDINDVAAMGGVNLDEESQRMQGATERIGTQIRSCKDETFLQTGLLHNRIAKICRDKGLDEPNADVIALMSHAAQERLKTLVEKLAVIAEHRMDIIRLEGDAYEVVQDVRGQIRFLSDLDKLERRRHEEAERELLLRAAKSRTKTEDPEKEKLKAKAKEMQRLEEEQLRHEKANNTALMAIGGPKKKLRLDGMDHQWTAVNSALGNRSLGEGGAMSTPIRPRIKRVNMRDLMFLMEQEKELKRSPLLFKAYSN